MSTGDLNYQRVIEEMKRSGSSREQQILDGLIELNQESRRERVRFLCGWIRSAARDRGDKALAERALLLKERAMALSIWQVGEGLQRILDQHSGKAAWLALDAASVEVLGYVLGQLEREIALAEARPRDRQA